LILTETGRELFLDLGQFGLPRTSDTSNYSENVRLDFGEFIKNSLRKSRSQSLYEPFLEYVTLPDLGCEFAAKCFPVRNGIRIKGEAPAVFEFLRGSDVTHILKVVVPDCLSHPHSSQDIITSLSGLNVRDLDWRKKDLTVDTILAAVPDVELLCLYASGNDVVLQHWIGKKGLERLEKLRHLKIVVLSGEFEQKKLEEFRKSAEVQVSALDFIKAKGIKLEVGLQEQEDDKDAIT